MLKSVSEDASIIPIKVIPEKVQALSRPVTRKEKVDVFWDDYLTQGIESVLEKYAPISIKSYIFFYLIKTLHKLRCYALIETIKKYYTV